MLIAGNAAKALVAISVAAVGNKIDTDHIHTLIAGVIAWLAVCPDAPGLACDDCRVFSILSWN